MKRKKMSMMGSTAWLIAKRSLVRAMATFAMIAMPFIGFSEHGNPAELLDDVIVPIPVGYVKVDTSSDYGQVLSKLAAFDDNSEMLAFYIRSEELDENGNLKKGENFGYGLMSIVVPKKLKNQKIALSDFWTLCDALKDKMNHDQQETSKAVERMASHRKKVLADYGEEVELNSSDNMFTPFRMDGSYAGRFGFMSKTEGKINGEAYCEYSPAAARGIWCKGQVMFLYRYTSHDNREEAMKQIETSGKILKEWEASIRSASGASDLDDLRYEPFSQLKKNKVRSKDFWKRLLFWGAVAGLIGLIWPFGSKCAS